MIITQEIYQTLMDDRKELLIDVVDLVKQRDDLNRLCEFNEKTMADLLQQRNDLLAALERADDILITEYDHVSPWVKSTIARVKKSK